MRQDPIGPSTGWASIFQALANVKSPYLAAAGFATLAFLCYFAWRMTRRRDFSFHMFGLFHLTGTRVPQRVDVDEIKSSDGTVSINAGKISSKNVSAKGDVRIGPGNT